MEQVARVMAPEAVVMAPEVVERELVEAAFAASRAFHALPEEAKAALAMDSAPRHAGEVRAGCGYLHEGQYKLPARSQANYNSAFVVKRECGPRDILLSRMPWPDERAATKLAGFRATVERYCDAMESLAVRMLPIYAVALGLEKDFFSSAFQRPLYRLRLSRYPPTKAGEYGINPHVDTSFFTILKPSAPGLVVQVANAADPAADAATTAAAAAAQAVGSPRWVRVPFSEGGDSFFIVNFGELLSQVTNDSWPATRHYAINGTHGERHALPFFFNATPTYRMAVVPSCCSEDNPPRHPPTSYLEGQGVAQGE